MQTVTALYTNEPINNGVTRPYTITCDDGNPYITKFMQNPEGCRVLANEYVCAKIAQFLELPLASPTLINVDSSFLEIHGEEIAAHIETEELISEGIHFGTKKIKKAFQILNSKMIEKATNIEVIPEIILFDQLICNIDRDRNGGNLLFDQSEMKIVVIDHSHVFEIGSLWDAHQLRLRIGGRFEPFAANGYVFRKLVPYVRGNNPFHSIIAKMSRMTDNHLWHIINTIPLQWGISDAEKYALHEYLCDRLHRIEEALPVIKPNLPFWKGGR